MSLEKVKSQYKGKRSKAEKVDAPAEGEDAPVKKERKTRISRKKAEDAEVAEITEEAPAAEVKEVEE